MIFVSKCSCEKLSSQFEYNVYGTMSVKACYNTLLSINRCHAEGDIKPCVKTVQTKATFLLELYTTVD